MPVVKATNPTFNGTRAGVDFTDGTAVCDANTAAVLAARFGYTVIDDKPTPTPTPVEPVEVKPAPRRSRSRSRKGAAE